MLTVSSKCATPKAIEQLFENILDLAKRRLTKEQAAPSSSMDEARGGQESNPVVFDGEGTAVRERGMRGGLVRGTTRGGTVRGGVT